MKELTAERLRAVLRYDPETGLFTRIAAGKGSRVGEIAGSLHKGTGYVRVSVDCQVFLAHRLAWLYMTGEWPAEEIDHKDGAKGDNRFANLRDVSRSINQQNKRTCRKDSATGILGVSPHRGQFVAQIGSEGCIRRLGVFGDIESAHAAYLAAKREMHAGCTT